MKEAKFYRQLDNEKVICELCPHFCTLRETQIGICGVRKNSMGKLYSLIYGKAIAVHIDPIEKKPLFHLAPGSRSFSIATLGCNFHCKFCQNHEISQINRNQNNQFAGQLLSPAEIVSMAKRSSCQSIAYTYTEPTIYFEYALDTARIAKEHGILNVFVTNGYINPAPLQAIKDYLDAANVDLKSFNDQFYRKLVGGTLAPVLETLKLMKKLNIWVEVTTLLIPGENDSPEELRQLASFIKTELGEETPWHISRFYPNYQLNHVPATSVSSLITAREIGQEQGIRYLYIGNVPGHDAENTFCYRCGELLIARQGYQITQNNSVAGHCKFCGAKLDGVRL